MVPYDEGEAFRRAIQSLSGAPHYGERGYGERWLEWRGDKSEVVDESEALSLAIQGIYADVNAEPGTTARATHEASDWDLEPVGSCPRLHHGGASARDLSSNDSADLDDSCSEQSFESDLPAAGGVPDAFVRSADRGLTRMKSSGSLVDLASATAFADGGKRWTKGMGRSSSCCTLMELGEGPMEEPAAAALESPGMRKVVSLDSMVLENIGLSEIDVELASAAYGVNRLPPELPDIPTPSIRAIAYLCALRPAAVAMSAVALAVPTIMRGTGSKTRFIAASVLGLSAATAAAAHFLERYVEAFDLLREHVRLAQYALHRVRKGEEEEELSLVTREGEQQWVASTALVPGDVLHLQEGRVPADCQLISACDLKIVSPVAKLLAKLPLRDSILMAKDGTSFISHAWWSAGGAGGGSGGAMEPIPKTEALSGVGAVALGTSIVKGGKATAIVKRIGTKIGVYLLLSRLSSLSLFEMLLLYPLGRV